MTKMITVLYLSEYKFGEEKQVQAAGLRTKRFSISDPSGQLTGGDLAAEDGLIIVRGPKLKWELYHKLWVSAHEAGADILTSPESFRIFSRFELYYPMIKGLSPRSIALDSQASAADVLAGIGREGLVFPVFVRSELESAAKYVGIEGCVVRKPELESVELIVSNLRRSVKNFETVIVKEMLEVAKTEEGTALEYRAVGARGKLLAFDHIDAGSKTPSPESLGLKSFADRAFEQLLNGGAAGAGFVDIAIVKDGRPIIVECKDFINGTIAHPAKIAAALLEWQGSVTDKR